MILNTKMVLAHKYERVQHVKNKIIKINTFTIPYTIGIKIIKHNE